MNIYDRFQKEILMRQGFSLFDKKKYQAALEKFAQAHDFNTDDCFASLWMGFCLTELEKFDEAREKYLEAISKSPDNIALKGFLATNYIDQSLYDDALQILLPLVSSPNISRPVYDSYGLCLLWLGKIDQGYKALTSQSKYLGSYGVSSRVFTICEAYLSKNIDKSIELEENIDAEMKESLDSKLRTVISNFFSRIAFWKKSRWETYKTLTEAEQAVDQKDYVKAKQLIESLMANKLDSKVTLSSAELLTRMKEYSEALKTLDSIDDDKKTKRIKSLKVLILLRLGNLKAAQSMLDNMSKEQDNVPDISYLYGLLYLKQGLFYKARKKFEKVLKVVNIQAGLDLAAIRLREALRVYSLVNKQT